MNEAGWNIPSKHPTSAPDGPVPPSLPRFFEGKMGSYEFARLPEDRASALVARGAVMSAVMVVPEADQSVRSCFWCGKVADVLVFGRLRQNARKVLRLKGEGSVRLPTLDNYTPCVHCAEMMSRGICLFEVEPTGGEFRPTRTYWVVTESFILQWFRPPAAAQQILSNREVKITSETAHRLGLYDDCVEEMA